jgi:hypothetical protein
MSSFNNSPLPKTQFESNVVAWPGKSKKIGKIAASLGEWQIGLHFAKAARL